MNKLLPNWLYDKISNNYLLDFITEIRIRVNKPITICYKGKYEILQERNGYGLVGVYANSELINYILTIATKQSFYAFNDQIKHGYITTDNGIRIGICGNVVLEDDKIKTIKNITSLNIRISHKIKGCSSRIIDLICQNDIIKNTLIISAPGAGKTTLIRDIAEQLSNAKMINNILIVDERFEIAGNLLTCDLISGSLIDVISGSPKHFAFHEAIKSMNPNVIITDEISEKENFDEILETARCGVKIIATAHAFNISDLKKRPIFEQILNTKLFERIVVLSKRKGFGTIEAVFDENLRGIYLPINI